MHQIHAFKQDNPFLQQLLGLLGVQHGRKYRIKRAIALKMRFPNLLFLEDTPLNIEGHGYNICFVKSKLRNPDRRIAEERVVSRMALYYTCQKTIISLKNSSLCVQIFYSRFPTQALYCHTLWSRVITSLDFRELKSLSPEM